MEISPDELEACLTTLQKIATAPSAARRDDRFKGLISKIYKETKRDDQREDRWRREMEDRALRAATGMAQIQRDALPAASIAPPPSATAEAADEPPKRRLNKPDHCYICKADFTELHFFYHLLCPNCAEFNYRMRDLHADLTGRTALITGGRVKIGYQTTLRLLRDGAKTIVTTRFPHAAARRLRAEPDAAEWSDRLHIYGLDLRNVPTVEAFARHLLDTETALDILIHNAAQTISRPRGFYQELIAQEQRPQDTLSLEARRLVRQEAPATLLVSDSTTLLPAASSAMGDALAISETGRDILPSDRWEDNEERADSRTFNSWLLRLDEVSAPEMLEVQLVNSVAPLSAQQPIETAADALAVRPPLHCERLRDGGAVPAQQNGLSSAYQYGESGPQHDDPHVRRGLRKRRNLYEQRGHRLGHR